MWVKYMPPFPGGWEGGLAKEKEQTKTLCFAVYTLISQDFRVSTKNYLTI